MNTRKRTIKGREVAADIAAGMTDPQLMTKYTLTEHQLEYLLQQLLKLNLITEQQLTSRAAMAETQVTKAFVGVRSSIQELDGDATGWQVTTLSKPLRTSRDALPKRDIALPTPQTNSRPMPRSKPKPPIKASQVVADLRAGLTDTRIMRKYSLAPPQLEFIFQKLLDAGHITVEELYNRASLSGSTITKAFMEVYDYMRELDEST